MRAILQDLTPPVDPTRDHWRGGEQAALTPVQSSDHQRPPSRRLAQGPTGSLALLGYDQVRRAHVSNARALAC
jgi:hypothetical protein